MKKLYKILVKYWYGWVVDIIETDDLYHYVGKLYLDSLNYIERIDYKVLDSLEECPVYEPCCKVCRRKCEKYLKTLSEWIKE